MPSRNEPSARPVAAVDRLKGSILNETLRAGPVTKCQISIYRRWIRR